MLTFGCQISDPKSIQWFLLIHDLHLELYIRDKHCVQGF
jgi:hypothetical protein